jgi:hypothetical protein
MNARDLFAVNAGSTLDERFRSAAVPMAAIALKAFTSAKYLLFQ